MSLFTLQDSAPMADTHDKNAAAMNVQADVAGAKPVLSTSASSSKGARRRKMAGLGQTSLSSHSPIVMPDAVLPSAPSEAPSALAEPEAIAPAIAATLVEAASADFDLPAKRGPGRPRKEQAAAPFIEGSPVATKRAAMTPVASKPIAVNPVAANPVATKSEPIERPAVEPAMEPVAASPVRDEATLAPAMPARVAEIAEPITPTDTTQSSDPSIKDMTMDMSANFNGFQGAMSEAQAKAQAAFEKSSSLFNEAGDFAKGNVEAMVESTKIIAEGVKGMGSNMVSEGRTAFETMTADVKELVAVKSPTDFFKLQSEMVRKNFDSAVAQSSKNTETFLKLMSDAFAPMSGRVSLAVEKARQVAPMNTAMSANV
jgi:hypothetical protein